MVETAAEQSITRAEYIHRLKTSPLLADRVAAVLMQEDAEMSPYLAHQHAASLCKEWADFKKQEEIT